MLFTHREYRAARILTRSLVDYGVRLEFYRWDSAAALEDLETAPAAMRRFLEPALDMLQADPDWPTLQLLFEGEPAGRRPRTTKAMMKRAFDAANSIRREELLKYHYDREYGIGSALSHGNEGSIWDVFGDLKGAAQDHQWSSRGVHANTLGLHIADGILWVARGIAAISGYHDEYNRLARERDAILTVVNARNDEKADGTGNE